MRRLEVFAAPLLLATLALILGAALAHADSRFYPFAGALVRHEAAVGESPKAILAAQAGTAYSLGPVALQARAVVGPARGRVFGRFEVEFGWRVGL